jgi:hypothetical protein
MTQIEARDYIARQARVDGGKYSAQERVQALRYEDVHEGVPSAMADAVEALGEREAIDCYRSARQR